MIGLLLTLIGIMALGFAAGAGFTMIGRWRRGERLIQRKKSDGAL